jgi:hypothetical protein
LRPTPGMRPVGTVVVWAAAFLALASGAAAQRISLGYRNVSATSSTRMAAPSLTLLAGAAQGPGRAAWSVPWRMPRRPSWSGSEVVLAGAFAAALWVDAAQTRALARGGWRGFRETNPILGPNPTVGQINAYTAVAGLTVLGAAAAVPARIRPWLLGAALAVETVTVAGTVRKGVAITFR